jgi:CBS domain-containing protein/nucleotide-binding universal stress UspA family protein
MDQVFRTILSPVDFDDNSVRALESAAALARLAEAKIFVLHVTSNTRSGLTRAALDARLAGERETGERLRDICQNRLGNLEHEVLTRTGDPAIAIIRTAEELNADVIVIATHAARRGPKAFAGSVAERVIRESICPVLSVRPTALGDPDAVGVHMTPGPVTISPETPVTLMRQMMARNRLRCMPVLENEKLVGIVTDRDLAFSDAAPTTTAGLLMTRDLVTVSPRTSIQEAARLLVECEIDALPVLENQRLVGIVTRADILKAFSDIANKG